MHPVMIDDMLFVDVIKLYSRIRKLQMREEEENDPDGVVWVKCQDTWF